MCIGYVQILPHFIPATWASIRVGIWGQFWSQSTKDTEGQWNSTVLPFWASSGLGLLEWVWQYIFLLCFHIYFLSTLGLGCISQDLSLPCAGFSLVAACGLQSQSLLSCLQECAIIVPWPGVKPSSAWQVGFLTTGPPGKFLAMCFKGS